MTTQTTIKPGDMFVGMWGYDQTQYSVYRVVSAKGQFVNIEGMNSWSRFDCKDLTVGSKVKVYTFKRWDQLTDEERVDLESRHFDRFNYQQFYRNEAIEQAEVRTIVKASRINRDKYSYLWELDNGQIINSKEDWTTKPDIHIVHGIARRKVSISHYENKPRITIDQVISATFDPEYAKNERKYDEQNEYTAYNGR